MRSRLLLFTSAFALTGLLVLYPRGSNAPARAVPLAVTPAPSAAPELLSPPPSAVTAAPALATPAPSAAPGVLDPADLVTLPPELRDDAPDEPIDPEPPRPLPKGAEVDELASTARETWVFAEPNWKSRKLGYLRAGAIVERASTPAVKNHGCPEGWYWIAPRGYVCVGPTATLNIFDPVVETSAKRPRMDGLPYTYVMSRFPPPPFYARLPSTEEAGMVEQDLRRHLHKFVQFTREPSYVEPPPAESIPGELLYGRSLPGLSRITRSHAALQIGQAKVLSGFALLSTFDYEGRRYGLTTDLTVLPIDRTRVIKPSSFAGIELGDEVTLPVAFVKVRRATRWLLDAGGAIKAGPSLGFREAAPITGTERRFGGVAYLEAKDGTLIRADQVVKIDRFTKAPAWATGARKWLDISILKQSLVAYEGKKPVYVTLVSTGIDGLGDPMKTHSTILGAFLIHTKHVSVTMDNDRKGEQFDFRDVPFVQYFNDGFALHTAYWHDKFGTPHSHGCINLAPRDAAKIFAWTTPELPPGWHAALSSRKGTLVFTHP